MTLNIISKIKYFVEYYIICHGSISKYWEWGEERKMTINEMKLLVLQAEWKAISKNTMGGKNDKAYQNGVHNTGRYIRELIDEMEQEEKNKLRKIGETKYYIDRNELFNALQRSCAFDPSINAVILSIPYKECRQGYWIMVKGDDDCKCSECGITTTKPSKYCSSCGAEMEGFRNEP